MEDDIVDAPAVGKLVALGAAGVGRRDHPRGFTKPQVKVLKIARHRVHIGEAVQIDERIATAAFGDRHLAAAQVQYRLAHCAISALRSISGKWRANRFAEACFRRGATSSMNHFMLLRTSASGMLPMWNWMSRWPHLACSTMSRMRR